jgi:hypothetical protein
MESERKHEALSTGLLVALGLALGVCLGQAGTARAILAHTHGHLRPMSAKSGLRQSHGTPHVTRSTPPSGAPEGPFRIPIPGADRHSTHAAAPVKSKKSHKPKHTKPPKPVKSPAGGGSSTPPVPVPKSAPGDLGNPAPKTVR